MIAGMCGHNGQTSDIFVVQFFICTGHGNDVRTITK